MATASISAGVGSFLRDWRQRRRMTQLELALSAGISARHLSFVETGRSKPGRDMLLRVAEHLNIPYRERNQILLVAGHAPAFPERPLQDPALAPVRVAIDRILDAHEPFPGIAFDRGWNLVAANAPASMMVEGVDLDPSLLEPPVNVLRLGLHPRGIAPYIVNLAHWRAHFLGRLAQQIVVTGDAELKTLMDELAKYPAGEGDGVGAAESGVSEILGPVRVRVPAGGEWSLFGMFASFDTPFEVTTSELALELLFPADSATQEALEKGAA
jgi:transcriptional regulator with XRE-family HTH domain